jgi:lysozyme
MSRAALLYLIAIGVAIALGGRTFMDSVKRLIAGEEGLRLTVYKDTGGVWTIGYGHKVVAGDNIYPFGTRRTITQAEADELFKRDTRAATTAVEKAVRVSISDNQRAALISLAFNIGGTALANSTLVRKLNAGDVFGAAEEFKRWVFDDGVKVEGLIARRERESNLFLA